MPDRKPRRLEEDDDDVPARKKKKKAKKEKAGPNWRLIGGISMGVFGVLMLTLIIWGVVMFGGTPPAKAVTVWEKHTSQENEFSFEFPARWKEKAFGNKGRREAEIASGTALITVKENLTGSLVADIANAAAGGQQVDDERSAVAQVHEMRRPKDLPNYKEERAVTVQTRFGKARRSDYTDGPKRGYRATVLMSQTALDVFCECNASDWETLRPAFERVIESLGRG